MWMSEFSVVTGPGAPAAVRLAVEALRDLPPEVRADLRLLGGELATSPGLVGRADGPVALRVRVGRRGGSTRLEIEAPLPAATGRDRPQEGRPPAGAPLLERVCARWGMARSTTAAVIWFEIDDRPGPAPSLCRRPPVSHPVVVAG
jgi:hypothetical protein